ncbi:dihydrofolate reductase [Rhabdobacter roseus]|uniref:Dipeptidyl-peptidase-3 n=1 Tax=Rhabdobacter roseus TaxID=1655419 RepID=A0A840THR9_9BACT|nr:dihydrofolate reductase [Rhabdobacter roseus]MBB5283014.1 dipeptidyl-peptidase-3 [Rhabdobacter roseus]
MKTNHLYAWLLSSALLFTACDNKPNDTSQSTPDFKVMAESFADLQVLRYQVPGWEELSLQQKTLAYYLYEAALSGRDIIYDQHGQYNLTVRKTLEAIYGTYSGSKSGEDWEQFQTYAGRVWFSNGLHHHYSNDKILPEFSAEYFSELIQKTDASQLPLQPGETVAAFLARVQKIIFDPTFQPKMVDLRAGIDNVVHSSNNFYEGVTQKEVEDFYATFPQSDQEPEWGLNSKVVKVNGQVQERVWKSGGMYGPAIDKIIFWLQKAVTVAENDQQKLALQRLVEYYQTGDLKKWDAYNIAWVADTASRLDVVNGFVEVYNDAIGKKGSFESVVSLKDMVATRRIKAIADQAQWFEDNAPLLPAHKKKEVKGISAKAITVIVEGGDATPSTPIGINLPNSDWVRKDYGSKSVSLSNIVHAYNASSAGSGFLDEFVGNEASLQRMKKYGNLASDLHTDMHECIGHASGQLNSGVGTPDKTLKNYASTLEEARADLVALYYIMDQKLVDIGVMPSLEVGQAEYDSYLMNGLMTQLTRLKPGDQIEEAHMRNRALNAYWVYEKGKADNVVEFVKKNGKTYVQVNDYARLRVLFGELLREIQRIKSEGDFEAGKALVETYGVKVNPVLHQEVLERYAKLNVKPYKGFIQPRLVPVMEGDKITDVKLEYPDSFFDQMLEYAKNYSYLPVMN